MSLRIAQAKGPSTSPSSSGGGSLTDAVILAPASSTRNVIQPTNAAYVPLTVKGAISQSANLISVENSSGTPLLLVGPTGTLSLASSIIIASGQSFFIQDNSAISFTFAEGGNNYLQFSTLNGSESILTYKPVISSSSGSGLTSGFILNSASPTLTFIATGGALNTKNWDIQAAATTLSFRTRTDANLSGTDYVVVTRSGTAVSSLAVNTTLTVNTDLGTPGAWGLSTVTSSAGNGIQSLDNVRDHAGNIFRIRMRTAGTPITALSIGGGGNVTIPIALSVSGTLDVTGIQTNGSAITFNNNGTAADASIWKSSGAGLSLRGVAGSSYDFALFSAGAGSYVARIPTATTEFHIVGAGLTVNNPATFLSTITVNGRITGNNDATFNLNDNVSGAFLVQQSTNEYLKVNTLNGSETVNLGNVTTNPSFNFLGAGTVTTDGALIVNNAFAATGIMYNSSRSGLGSGGVSASTLVLVGSNAVTRTQGSGTTQYGMRLEPYSGTDATSEYMGLTVQTGSQAGTFNLYGVRIKGNYKTTGTVTNSYGLYIEPQTVATNNWAIYTSSGLVEHGGNLLVGGTTTLSSALFLGTATLTTNTTINIAYNTIFANPGAGGFTITLPPAAGNAGLVFTILKIDITAAATGGGNPVTIDGNGSETIGGALNQVLQSNTGNGRLKIICDGSNWQILELYDQGSFTGTLTGCTTSPTTTMYYSRINTNVSINLATSINGTSNSASMTVTGLPSSIAPTRQVQIFASVFNNAVRIAGTAIIIAGSTTIEFGAVIGFAGSFTASGPKGFATDGYNFTYNQQ